MKFIGLSVFHLSLTSDDALWFYELPCNLSHTSDQLHKVFMAKYFLLSKELNHKDKLNNFVVLQRNFGSSSWDRFSTFIRSIPNHKINDKSLKESFYRGWDDNGKAMHDTIVGGLYVSVLLRRSLKNSRKFHKVISHGELGILPPIESHL